MSRGHLFRAFYFLLALVVLGIDRVTKLAIVRHIDLNDGFITVIPGFFTITHVENRGAAFGIFNESPTLAKYLLLVGFSSLAVVIVIGMLWKLGTELSTSAVGLALILGGAVGNQWDRILHRRVTDFLHFYVGRWSWPDFNAADSAIVVGAALLIYEIAFPRKSVERETSQ